MMKKKITQIICMAIMLCGLTVLSGCMTEEYSRADVIKYVTENLGIKKFSVSKDYEEVTEEDGYTDKLWTVTVEEKDDLTFFVRDDFHWGMEWLVNTLVDDYRYAALVHLYEKYGKCEHLELYVEENVTTYARLVGSYDNLDELKALFAETKEFAKYVDECEYDIDFNIELHMENPLRDNEVSPVDDGDYNARISVDGSEDYEADYEEAVNKYLLTCITYRFEDKLSEFTEEEIKEDVENYEYRVAVLKDGERVFYEDLCGKQYSSSVTNATLYEILVREGVEVTGDSRHYSFTGPDGSVYEISDDFCDYVYYDNMNQGETRNGFYYIKNGEKVPRDYYYYNYFWKKDVLEMTGIEIYVGKLTQE